MHFTSCHPYHTKKGIPYSQALRLRRICSDEGFFELRAADLTKWLTNRGYNEKLVTSQIQKVRKTERESILLGNNNREKEKRDVIVVTYHPAISHQIYDILRENQNILSGDREHKQVFPSMPMVAFRKAKTLKDVLVRARVETIFTNSGECTGCHRSNCEV